MITTVLEAMCSKIRDAPLTFVSPFFFFRSWTEVDETDREEALLLCLNLLPVNHLSTLIYLANFFARVAQFADDNKMDLKNLAIVLAPTFFPLDATHRPVSVGPGPGLHEAPEMLKRKTEILVYFFRKAEKVSRVQL